MKKIDIHSHILPGIDDGAKDEKESLKMLKIAAKDGITDIIATPHFHYRRGHAAPEQVKNAAAKMQELLNDSGIPIQLHIGNELYYTHELLETVKAGAGLTLAGSDYVLLEFSPETEKRKIQHAVYQFLTEGYYPIIAHMERYAAFQTHPDFIDEIREMGAYYQLNAGSLTGQAGWRCKRFAKSMIRDGLIHFVATDAHDTERRIPEFSKAETWLMKKCGESETSDYLYRNPKMILDNKVL